jgi:DNA helicase-2/ATP-dependent DNA helicase PcrA
VTPLPISTPEELRRVLRADFTFSDQQFAAISAPLEPAVVIAGAGSGKTSVMAARVVYLVATGQLEPSQVLGLTFTTKATAELGNRIRDGLVRAGFLPGPGERLAEDVEEPTVATYHSYAAALLSEHGLRIGHEPDTRLIADASRYQLAGRTVQRYTTPVEHLSDSPPHVLGYLLRLDAELGEHLVTPARLREYDVAERARFVAALKGETRTTYRDDNERAIFAIDRRAEALGLVEAYRRLKAGLGLMDFSDQIALAARLAQECPDVGAIEREKFKVVLLDEYQDTSVAQARMLSRLFGDGHPVTAVGDPNQAIYGWRGASVSNILNFNTAFPAANGPATTYPLTVNRRSDRRILATANHLATPLYDARPDLRPLEPKADAGDGEVEAVVLETYDGELAWLAGAVEAAHRDTPWREIGVLTRDNAHAADVFDALTAAGIPVEIVGLNGLLRLPEVAEVVATLTLIQDVTANAALLTLLAGPRWAIGPRDLALLGRRGRILAGGSPRARGSLHDELRAAVDGADPAELVSLSDALEDPGDLGYSTQARQRFAMLAAELRRLRGATGEPILELVRRIIDTTGIDVELASSVSPAAAARRDNLDLFVQAVAEFQAVDGSVTLAALLAWLEAEDEFGQGLDVATPSEADSVKLLTAHRAKGLEWDVVFVVGVTDRKFPTDRARSTWLTIPDALPYPLRGDNADLPVLGGHTPEDIRAFKAAVKDHERTEELRLGYVAWTRARHRLSVSGWCWKDSLATPRGPSTYLERTREAIAAWGGRPLAWVDKPGKADSNPYAGRSLDLPWPISHHTTEVDRRRDAASRVAAATTDVEVDLVAAARVAEWDDDIDKLLDEARRQAAHEVVVPRPTAFSATALGAFRTDPDAFAAALARPMPRHPSPAARFGTRFHAWVEARSGQQPILDPDELPGRGDLGIDDDADLRTLVDAFGSGPFADRPPVAVEAPFSLVLAGQVVRGRIDAVYADGDGYLLVDWKTGRLENADPVQLAVYRIAWAELHGVPPSRVRAGFYYVRSGRLVEPDDLPNRAELAALVS